MNIQTLKFGNSENSIVVVTMDDGMTFNVPWPCQTYHSEMIKSAIESGITIQEFKTTNEIEIESIKSQISQIEKQRDLDLVAGCMMNGNLYHSDDRFVSELMMLIQGYQLGIFPPDMSQNIRTKDNLVVQLNKDSVIQLTLTIGQYRQQVYQSSWNAKDSLRIQLETLLSTT